MGEADRYNEYKRPKQKFTLGQDGNNLMSLVIVNVTCFLILLTIQVIYFFFQQSPEVYNAGVIQWFEMPGSLTKFSERPWAILTYVFSDTGNNILRILGNLIWLAVFGSALQEYLGQGKLIPVYIYGGIAGGLVFLLCHYIIPELVPQQNHAGMIGANTGTMAVAAAIAALAPHHKFFQHIRGGVSLWIIMAIYVIIDIAGIKDKSVAHAFAHIAGAAAGFIFILLLKKDIDLSAWMNRLYHGATNLFNPDKKAKSRIKSRMYYDTGNRAPFHKKPSITQQRVDEILEKIHQKGYDKLSQEEKDILKKAAEEDL